MKKINGFLIVFLLTKIPLSAQKINTYFLVATTSNFSVDLSVDLPILGEGSGQQIHMTAHGIRLILKGALGNKIQFFSRPPIRFAYSLRRRWATSLTSSVDLSCDSAALEGAPVNTIQLSSRPLTWSAYSWRGARQQNPIFCRLSIGFAYSWGVGGCWATNSNFFVDLSCDLAIVEGDAGR